MSVKNDFDRDFTQVQNEIIDDTTHFGKFEKWVWLVLARYGYTESAFPSQKTIAASVGISDRKVRDCLVELEKKGWLVRNGMNEKMGTVKWIVTIPAAVQIEWKEKQLKKLQGKKTPDPKKDPGNPKPEPKGLEVPREEIIDYLNLKAKSKFRHNTANTIKAINGRWADGFRMDDFKKVIDTKVAEWIGTEWEKYLNPETLFRPANFEKYLNQRPVKPQLKEPTFAAPKQTGEVMTEEQRAALLATIDEF